MGGQTERMTIEFEVDSYIQTLVSGKKRVHTIVYTLIKKKVFEFFNDLPETEGSR